MVELPKYSGSWGSVGSQECGAAKTDDGGSVKEGAVGKGDEIRLTEKELPAIPEERARASSYYDDASDEEEAREIGVAREVGIARSSSRRMEFSRKMS